MSYFYTFQFNCVTLNILNIFDVFYQKIQKTVDETEIPLSNQNTLLYTSCHSNTQNTTTTQAKKSTFRVHFGGGGTGPIFTQRIVNCYCFAYQLFKNPYFGGPRAPKTSRGHQFFQWGPQRGGGGQVFRKGPGFWPQGGPQENNLWGWGAGPIFNQRIWKL